MEDNKDTNNDGENSDCSFTFDLYDPFTPFIHHGDDIDLFQLARLKGMTITVTLDMSSLPKND